MLVNILAQAVHETGHHMVYQAMGQEPVWAFTKFVQKENPIRPSNWLYLASLPTGKTEKALMACWDSSVRCSVFSWLAYVIAISLVPILY